MNQWEEFALWTDARLEWLHATGEDMAPGTAWSAPIETAEYLDGLQDMGDPLDDINLPYWAYLHVGGERPH